MACSVIVVVLALLLLGLRGHNQDWAMHLHSAIRWTRPQAMYRVLILGPIWGAWAMLITCQLCKPDDKTSQALVALRRGCGPFSTAAALVLPLGGSVWYFNYLPWTQLSISAAPIIAAVAGGCWLCHRVGGLRRSVLLAVNIQAQLAFILAFLAIR